MTIRTRNQLKQTAVLLLAIVAVADLAGCASTRSRLTGFRFMKRQAIARDASIDQICAKINANVADSDARRGLRAWRSDHVRVTFTGMPAMLPATLAVQSPSSLRLRISNPLSGGDEADLGSNSDRFWFWAKDGGSRLFTAKHEHSHLVAKQLQIPFEPDWVIDVLGVRTVDAAVVERRPTHDPDVVELAEPYRLPNGLAAERVARVDLREGRIIGHELRQRGRMIAEARITSWNDCKKTGLKTPGTIRLKWPEKEMAMTLYVSRSEANPPDLSAHSFILPQRPGCQLCDLSEQMGAEQFAEAATAAASSAAALPPTQAKSLTPPQPISTGAYTPQPIAGSSVDAPRPSDDFQPFFDEPAVRSSHVRFETGTPTQPVSRSPQTHDATGRDDASAQQPAGSDPWAEDWSTDNTGRVTIDAF